MVILRILTGLITSILQIAAIGLKHLTVVLAGVLVFAAAVVLIFTLTGTTVAEILHIRRKRRRP